MLKKVSKKLAYVNFFLYLCTMKSMGTTALLQEQLRLANQTIDVLSRQIAELTETIRELREQLSAKDQRIDEVYRSMNSLEKAITDKNAELTKAQNINRGLSHLIENKSEKMAPAEPKEKVDLKARGNNNAKRNMHMDMEVWEHEAKPQDIDFETARLIGTRESIRYEYQPGKFIKHIYKQYSYQLADQTVARGIVPAAPLMNSSFDGSFIAGVMELRYMYSMSVERIADYFNHHGFEVSKATLNGLLTKTAGLCEKLYKCLGATILTDSELKCDETYMKVMIPEVNDSGKHIKKGYIWVVIAKHLGLIYYFYDEGSRSEKVILNYLKGYRGTIQSDGFAPYRKLGGKSFPMITRLACLQHIKRKFMDIEGDPDADKIIELINQLYHNEHQHTIGEDGWTENKNLRWRKKYATPILKQLKDELNRIIERPDLDPSGVLYKATRYMLNEMPDVENIFRGGAYELDNNTVERYNRYISMSRRNSLFFGSHDGAGNGALLYSLACSCRMQGINFFEYITDVLNQQVAIGNGADPSAYRHLLPDEWKRTHNQQ